jgi:hypothetical protein
MHYSSDCLCKQCKDAGNRRYIGGSGVYNINMQNNEIKEWEKEFDEKFIYEMPKHFENYAILVDPEDNLPVSDIQLKLFISTLLSEHRNKVLEEAKGVVEEEKRKYTKCVHILCECSGRIESLKNTLESIDKLKNK